MLVELIGSPAMWAVLGGLIGVVVTAIGRREDRHLTALQTLTERLDAQVRSLERRVDVLEAERDSLGRKLRAALDWGRRLVSWGEEVSDLVDPTVDVPAVPVLPQLLSEEY